MRGIAVCVTIFRQIIRRVLRYPQTFYLLDDCTRDKSLGECQIRERYFSPSIYFPLCNVTPLLLLRKQDPTSPVVIGRYFGKKGFSSLEYTNTYSSPFLCLFRRGLPLLYSTTLVGTYSYFPFVCIKERERSHYKREERGNSRDNFPFAPLFPPFLKRRGSV